MTDFVLKPRWDVFCKIVDNFGDIGVCWRLARQLQVEYGLQIRLWIDDLAAAQKIIPSLNVAENSQVCDQITILKWSNFDKASFEKENEADFNQAADVVIEAFACGLPSAYLAVMVQQQSPVSKTKWINLEYLSAETWVDDFHGKPSPQDFIGSANGLTRYFYFPGFTEKTGGLIREERFNASNIEQYQQHLNPSFPRKLEFTFKENSRWTPAFAGMTEGKVSKDSLKISLFCYPHAPIHNLLTAIAESNQRINCYVLASSVLPIVASYFGKNKVKVGDIITKKNLTVEVLPFLSQADYDKLLRECDINFVRGEDSWVRAIWAGKPFIWQPYFQDENTHIKKLNAFLDLFYANFDAKQMVCEAHSAWVTGQLSNEVWRTYLDSISAISTFTRQQSNQLAKQTDLAAKLVIFCNKL